MRVFSYGKRHRFLSHAADGKFVSTIRVWSPDNWDEGWIGHKGRFVVYRPDYPRARSRGHALRAHVVYWLATGVCIPDTHDMHHKNRDRLDDRLENLEPLLRADHLALHAREREISTSFTCEACGSLFVRPRWREKGRNNRFCSQVCYHAAPRSPEHKKRISEGLARAHAEGSQ